VNQTFSQNNLGDLGKTSESADQSARQLWVKPALERLSLKDALTGGPGGLDGGSGS
jgi:hypothetical protein